MSISINDDECDNENLINNDDEDVFDLSICGVTLAAEYYLKFFIKTPCRTSPHTYFYFIKEIFEGHHKRCNEMFRMEKHVFLKLCKTLHGQYGFKATRRMTLEDMVAMFLMVIGHGVGNRMIQERFQHSGETVSRQFHHVLLACLKLAIDNIKPKNSTFSDIHPKLRGDERYWPYFKNSSGDIDGIYVPCIVPSDDQIKYIGRKGFTSKNIMAVCDWNMCFTFVWPGWEGTAHDVRIFDQALRRQNLKFPHPPSGKYYLVESGYPTMKGYLGPYKGGRYHLPDFAHSSNFRNPNEAFNFFHSSLRCTIERTFGVYKNRFSTLRSMPSFKFDTQVHLVTSTMAIHNFIRRHSSTNEDFNNYASEDIVSEFDEGDGPSGSPLEMPSRFSTVMEALRNRIRDEIVENCHHT